MKRRAVFGAVVLSLALCSTAHAQFSPGARSLGDRLLPLIGNGGYDVQHYDLTINYDAGRQHDGVLDGHHDSRHAGPVGVQPRPASQPDRRRGHDRRRRRDRRAPGGHDKLVVTPAAGIANNRVFHADRGLLGHAGRDRPTPTTRSRAGSPITGGAGFVVNEPMGAMGWFPNNNHPSRQGDVRLPHHGAGRAHRARQRRARLEGRQRRPDVDVELAHERADGELPEHVDRRPVRLPRRGPRPRRPAPLGATASRSSSTTRSRAR